MVVVLRLFSSTNLPIASANLGLYFANYLIAYFCFSVVPTFALGRVEKLNVITYPSSHTSGGS